MDSAYLRLIIVIAVYLVLGFYGFQAVKTVIKNPWIHTVYRVLFFGTPAALAYFIYSREPGDSFSGMPAISAGVFMAFLVLITILAIFMLIEDIYRVVAWMMNHIVGVDDEDQSYMPSRRQFISGLAIATGTVPFAGLLYGMYKGKHNYQVRKYQVEFDDLPASFDGYRIVQISDIHAGSWLKSTDYKRVKYGVDLVNKQEGDLIVFTGDMVNDRADEVYEWSHLLSTLTAPDGKYSILGNHDYGDYYGPFREDPVAKDKNLQNLLTEQRNMGFDPLLNEHRFIRRNGEEFALVGVENWGTGGFSQKGDLDKASEGLTNDSFKVLLSHDPSHWREQVLTHTQQFHLTLSGHTHGFQFGIEIPQLKWSPVQYRYKEWAGIYQQGKHFINVNRGFGFLGYPGRVGIWPEISVITLKKKGEA